MTTATQSNGPKEKLTIIKYPDPVLKQVSTECTEADLDLIKASVPDMTEAMNALKGIGLAAVQVGINKRFCLLKDSNTTHVIINPEIVASDLEHKKVKEGCLSLPYFYEFVDRFQNITIKYRDEQWIERTSELYGLEAQCLQHEIDHMNGILQEEKVSLMVRSMWIKKAKKKGAL